MSGPRDTMAAAWADDGLDRLPLGVIAMLAGGALWAAAMLVDWLLPVGGAA